MPVAERSDLDRWILARLERLVGAARRHYEGYAVHLFMRETLDFVDALSRWYLRRGRRRFWKTDDDADKLAAYQTLWECLVTSSKLLAPVIPFAAEAMYQELVRAHDAEAPVSVHLCDFPEAGRFAVDEELLAAMDAVLALVEQGHAARNRAGIKVRQPLAGIRVAAEDPKLAARIEPFLPMVLDELNVKEAQFVESAADLYTLDVRFDGKVARPKYKRLYNALAAALGELDPAAVEAKVKAGAPLAVSAEGETVEIEPGELLIEKTAAEGWAIAEGNGLLVAADTRLDDALRREGEVRDLVRKIQSLRKEIDLQIDDRIRIAYTAPDELAETIEEFADYISGEVLALRLERSETPPVEAHQVKLAGQKLAISIEKVG